MMRSVAECARMTYEEASQSLATQETHHLLGITQIAAKRYGDAVSTFQTTLKKWPHSNRSVVALGQALHFASRYEEAKAQYELALQVTPATCVAAHADPSLNVCVCMCVLSAQRDMSSVPCLVGLGSALLSLGDAAAAATRLKEAVRLAPRNAEANKRLEEAQAVLDKQSADKEAAAGGKSSSQRRRRRRKK